MLLLINIPAVCNHFVVDVDTDSSVSPSARRRTKLLKQSSALQILFRGLRASASDIASAGKNHGKYIRASSAVRSPRNIQTIILAFEVGL